MNCKTPRLKASLTTIAAYIFIAFCALMMSLYNTTNPFFPGRRRTDSAVFTYVASVILKGGMPYKDTFDHKGPLIYIIDAAGLRLSNSIGIWIIELLTLLVIFIFAYKTARLLGCRKPASCFVVFIGISVLGTFFEGGNLTEEYACAFLSCSLYIFVKFFLTKQVSRWELIICGACFAAVCLLRINMAVLWCVMCPGVLIDRIKAKKPMDICRFILWFVLGAAVVILPILYWLFKNGAGEAFLNEYFRFNTMYSSDAARASVKNRIDSILVFFTKTPVVLAVPILLFFIALERKGMDILCLITLAFSIVMSSISGQVYGHYGMILYPPVIYAIARGLAFLRHPNRQNEKVPKAVFYASVLLFILAFLPTMQLFSENIYDTVFVAEKEISDEEKIAERIKQETEPDDYISVCGNKDNIYLLSERQSVSKYSYQSPIAMIDPEIAEEFLGDLRTKKAKVVLIDTRFKLEEKIKEVIQDDYELIDHINVFDIYKCR